MKTIKVQNLEISNNNPFALIAGPCQMESRDHAMMMCEQLKELTTRLNIPFIYKTSYDKANRTSLTATRGIGLEKAMSVFDELRDQFDVPCLTDIHTAEQCAIVANHVDVLQIPAFLCRQTDLLVAAAQTGAVINVKKGQFLAPWDMKNVVEKEHGTAHNIYSEDFSMAGKTGTVRTEYWFDDWASNKRYISSFTGYFPAENPKYSCIVVIHKPDTKTGFYGADVSGPVFKDIAQKIYTSNHIINKIKKKIPEFRTVQNSFNSYYTISNKEFNSIPSVKGMVAMDAIPLLENIGLKVKFNGSGKVIEQSINAGEKLIKGATIILKSI
ncbi:MAG: hypothetical protein COB76_06135 [Alphaproteobacteria bacterium]|nr:MAG: hypothetical protein COB76_06135 [Alphaproteobacteria bacterium]